MPRQECVVREAYNECLQYAVEEGGIKGLASAELCQDCVVFKGVSY